MIRAILSFVILTAALAAARHIPIHRHARSPYRLQDDYTSSPEHFFSPAAWTFENMADPTHGAVTYIDAPAAAAAGLIRYVASTPHASTNASTSGAPVYIGLGSSTASTPRTSVRMRSTATYNTGTLIIADVAHMPVGCGTWPALWMLNTDLPWPLGGEWDIIENVNNAAQVAVSLHTTSGCALTNSSSLLSSASQAYTGSLTTPDCDIHAPRQAPNTGCSILAPPAPAPASFGPAFNDNGGGVFAAEWTRSGFRVWFFARGASAAFPPSLLTSTPDPATFGAPVAAFTGAGCDWAARFHDMRLVLDTTLCGDWAGAEGVWGEACAASTGEATCEAWVESAGEQGLSEAYWEIKGLRVYVL